MALSSWKKKVRRRLRFEWETLLKCAGAIRTPARRRVVLIREIPKGGRFMDEDNLAASTKPVLDALKRYFWERDPDGVVRRKPCPGLIWEDSKDWIDVDRRQVRVDRERLGRKDSGQLSVEVRGV